MSSIGAALDALDAAVELLGAADIEELPAPQRFAPIERLETAVRRLVAVSHTQITRLERYQGACHEFCVSPRWDYYELYSSTTEVGLGRVSTWC
ncbi:MAG TPA: hypothetical protein VGA66_15010 [Mycobacterium sp.]